MKFTKKQIEEFDQQSLKNLVHFFRRELYRVIRGESIFDVVPHGVRMRLIENDVLYKGHNFDSAGSFYFVTDKGKEMLKDR